MAKVRKTTRIEVTLDQDEWEAIVALTRWIGERSPGTMERDWDAGTPDGERQDDPTDGFTRWADADAVVAKVEKENR